jgi:hypothetical protein
VFGTLQSCGGPAGPESDVRRARTLADRLGAHAAVFLGFDRARIVAVEILGAGMTVDRDPGTLDRYLGPYGVTATSGPLGSELVAALRSALADPGSYVTVTAEPGPQGRFERLLVLEKGEGALTVGLLLDERCIVAGAAQVRGRGRTVLRLSEQGHGALISLLRVPLAPTGG